jgi:two-component system, NarL family, nitrate/nitrite response regulator NarL
MKAGRLRILLADDHPIVLAGLERLLSVGRQFDIVATSLDGAAALRAIHELEPDIALLDINMPKLSGLDVLEALEESGLSTKTVLLTATATDSQVTKAVIHGAWGIMLKDSAAEALLQCLEAVSSGERWLPHELIDPALQRDADRRQSRVSLSEILTQREQEIARLVANGLSNKQIGKQVGISDGTVKIHLHNIYNKLDVTNRTALATLVQRTEER